MATELKTRPQAQTTQIPQYQPPEPSKPKKKGKKKWFLIAIAIIVALSMFNGGTDSKEETNSVDETIMETTSLPNLSPEIESMCRTMTKRFIENVVDEDYSMFAFNIQSFELHDNNGEIRIIYFPENAGADGATKVNLTIVKTDNTYKIEYALLNGLYEVELSELTANYITMSK